MESEPYSRGNRGDAAGRRAGDVDLRPNATGNKIGRFSRCLFQLKLTERAPLSNGVFLFYLSIPSSKTPRCSIFILATKQF